MFRKICYALFLISLIAGLSGAPYSSALADDSPALVAVSVQSRQDLRLFHETGLPAYALLEGYILAGADAVGQQDLRQAGLPFRLLETRLGSGYYLATRMPSVPHLDWKQYGRLLLDLGDQALLKTNRVQAARLSKAGTEQDYINLTPVVLPIDLPAESVFPEAVSVDPLVQYIIDQVDEGTVLQYDRQLAGELPVWVDGEDYEIDTRYTYSGTPIQKATSYVGQFMASKGLAVEYHNWEDETYPNVIGEITGETNPDDIFIIGAHLDDVQNTPGADDNASGSVATLLAAELLSEYDFNCTVRFAFWTGEEQGLLGSDAYAQRSFDEEENILGYLNLDMIAYNTTDTAPDIDLIYNSSIRPTRELAQLMSDVIEAYSLDLIPEMINSKSGDSDHASFWDRGYTSILTIEDQDDFSPFYHTEYDTPTNTNLAYFTEAVKASLATFLHMSGCIVPSGMGTLQGTVTDADNGTPIPNASIEMQDADGTAFYTQTDDFGEYSQRLMADTYTVTASANGYLPAGVSGVPILTNQVTMQNFSLEPGRTYLLSGTVTEAGSGWPLYAHITFDEAVLNTWTDPDTGYYEILLPAGEYTMYVTADLHAGATRDIILSANQTQDFELELIRCVLLVDDDQNDPDTRSYYTSTLEILGVDYDIWDVASAGSPGFNDVASYVRVLWYLGGPYGDTFTSYNESVIASYLDTGGSFFLSGQDYLYDMGLTSFGTDYLHIGGYTEDEILNAVTGVNVYSGLGPYPLDYTPFENYSDVVHPDGQSLVAFTDPIGDAAISYDGPDFNTVFLGFSLEAIETPEYRSSILAHTLDFMGPCSSPQILSDPQFVDVQVETGQTTSSSFTLRNVTSTALNYLITEQPAVSWLSYSPPAGNLMGYASQTVTLNFDASLLTPGVYTTSLDIAINDQPQVEIALPVTLSVLPPCEAVSSISFFWSPSRPSDTDMITFYALSDGTEPLLYLWDFGDGHTSQGTPVTHTYATGGVYDVALSVSNTCSVAQVRHFVVVTPVLIKLPLLFK
jgi:PKD repeat protein